MVCFLHQQCVPGDDVAVIQVANTHTDTEDWRFLWHYVDLWPLRAYLRFFLSAHVNPRQPCIHINLRLNDDHAAKPQSATPSTASVKSVSDE